MTFQPMRMHFVAAAFLCLPLVGCGGGSPARAPGPGANLPAVPGTSAPSEAQSAATGDIPDNQAFLTFVNKQAGYSISYPEGWARRGSTNDIIFQNRANVIHVVTAEGSPPTLASAAGALAVLRRVDPTVSASAPRPARSNGEAVLRLTYTRLSTADPVTGKRLPVTVDRYEYARGGKVAIVDLATAKGVDNVDAYRMISRSFRWR